MRYSYNQWIWRGQTVGMALSGLPSTDLIPEKIYYRKTGEVKGKWKGNLRYFHNAMTGLIADLEKSLKNGPNLIKDDDW